MDSLGLNTAFTVYRDVDGINTPYKGLVIHKATVESVVMSLGDKISGDAFYKDNKLLMSEVMQCYIEHNGVRYTLVNPPTVVREGMVSENRELSGMTKYSFVFYHPMYQLANLPFTDIAVTDDEERYLSQNKTFYWIGYLKDFAAKLNANLRDTEWVVELSEQIKQDKLETLSEVLSFDGVTIADALKTGYETWEVPFVIDTTTQHEGKKFMILFGLPSNEIYSLDEKGNKTDKPFVFKFGQGLGLKNNSATPKNNKIVTRIAGYGSETNVPYGYPQIVWKGNQEWDYTINNDGSNPLSYPIYDGIVEGENKRLIKHPFTRTTLMPSVYSETVNKKVNPFASGYNPNTQIIDYHDAIGDKYPNPINPIAPSYEIHNFDDIKPELGDESILGASPSLREFDYMSESEFYDWAWDIYADMPEGGIRNAFFLFRSDYRNKKFEYDKERNYIYSYCNATYIVTKDGEFDKVRFFASDGTDFTVYVLRNEESASVDWNDDIDDDGNYIQSYFKITLPKLSFDIFACAAITQEMKINMRSGACIGCTFPVQVDWDLYKNSFYNANGVFAPYGEQRDYDKFPDSSKESVTLILQKEDSTFGTLMPNIYQRPKSGDKFVILGISLPLSYVENAQKRLDEAMDEYMLENNAYYYDYPIKVDEHFLATYSGILSQIRNNTIFRFEVAGEEKVLYVKQLTIKYGQSVLPQYDITVTDDVEIVLNQIGQVTDDVSRMRVQLNDLAKWYDKNFLEELNNKLSRISDDVALGRITFQHGITSVGNAIFGNGIASSDFVSGLYDGRGWQVDKLGNAEFESVRVRSFFEVIQLLVNRQQAEEGDTLFTDNDQIEYVEKGTDDKNGSTYYVLTLKEKWEGYITGQMYGNILRGIINTLAAKQAGVSDESGKTVEIDGSNSYYTSWMRVIGTHNTDATLGVNQVRVVMYGDNDVPAQRNFEPCELMTIARWGCVDYSKEYEGSSEYDSIVESIKRRQRSFYISSTDGRITKLNGVSSPILKNANYGTTLGELPEFVKNFANVRERYIEGRDYLYAQGVVVGDFIPVTVDGETIPRYMNVGDWVDGKELEDNGETPVPGHGIYFCNSYDEELQQYVTHQVRHNSVTWQCLQNQPVINGSVKTYYEPKWNSPYWMIISGNSNLSIEFVSSRGYQFRHGNISTEITPYLYYGDGDISEDVADEYWNWYRESENGKTVQDETWDLQHRHTRAIKLTDDDMPQGWSNSNKAIFTCEVTLNDGKTTRIVQNQVIA